MAWQRLSQRTAGVQPDGPYEGMPPHLHASVADWFHHVSGAHRPVMDGGVDGGRLMTIAAGLRVQTPVGMRPYDLMNALIEAATADDDLFLDLIDGALHVFGARNNLYATVSLALAVGGSAWTVADDHVSLTRVVNDQAQATFDVATSTQDEVSVELREAWANAFGLNGDPSDAWDHAIKAVEDVLIPVVCPNKAKANLGGVIGDLDNQGHVWKFCLPGHDLSEDVAPLVSMLRLVWPNHDRHGGGGAKRIPPLQEARAVVTLAATIVQWHRDGWVVQRR